MRKLYILLALFLCIALPAQCESLCLVFFDVGQGDSALALCGDSAMLVDAGTSASAGHILSRLEALDITQLDLAVATHPHADHIGGMAALIEECEMRNFWMPRALHDTLTYERMLDALARFQVPVRAPDRGDTFTLGEACVRVLSRPRAPEDAPNLHSIVLLIEFEDTAVLLMADAEPECESALLEDEPGLWADVVKIAHHGAQDGTSEAFLERTNPQIAVISCGEDNPYGHPDLSLCERLNERGATVYRTDQAGDVALRYEGGQWEAINFEALCN